MLIKSVIIAYILQTKLICFEFCLRKVAIVSDDLIVTGSWFHAFGVGTEKARLPILNFVLYFLIN